MKPRFLALLAFAGVVSGGFLVLEEISAHVRPNQIVEQRVNANLLRVRVRDHWEELPLMPLADHACQSGDSHFERYCD
jgi:hypothetical protein